MYNEENYIELVNLHQVSGVYQTCAMERKQAKESLIVRFLKLQRETEG